MINKGHFIDNLFVLPEKDEPINVNDRGRGVGGGANLNLSVIEDSKDPLDEGEGKIYGDGGGARFMPAAIEFGEKKRMEKLERDEENEDEGGYLANDNDYNEKVRPGPFKKAYVNVKGYWNRLFKGRPIEMDMDRPDTSLNGNNTL